LLQRASKERAGWPLATTTVQRHGRRLVWIFFRFAVTSVRQRQACESRRRVRASKLSQANRSEVSIWWTTRHVAETLSSRSRCSRGTRESRLSGGFRSCGTGIRTPTSGSRVLVRRFGRVRRSRRPRSDARDRARSSSSSSAALGGVCSRNVLAANRGQPERRRCPVVQHLRETLLIDLITGRLAQARALYSR